MKLSRRDPFKWGNTKLGETSTQNIKEHESSEKITISMLQTDFLTFKNFVMEEISSMNEKISWIFLNSGKQKETKELKHLKIENETKTLINKKLFRKFIATCKFKNQKSRQAKWYKGYKNNPPRETYFHRI